MYWGLCTMNEKREFRAKLKALEETREPVADAMIMRRVRGLSEYQKAACVLLYLSIGHEVDTYQLIEQAFSDGKRVCVPRCYTEGIMDAVEISSLSELNPGMYGILEPDVNAPAFDAGQLDLILVPAMAFDRARNRLGRGAGYYDRFLERAEQAVTVGVCRSTRLFDCVPHEPHDKKVDILITEHEVIK